MRVKPAIFDRDDGVDEVRRRFDLGRGVWTKPAHQTKQKRTEHLSLSAQALALVASIHRSERSELSPPIPGNKPGQPLREIKKFWSAVLRQAGIINYRRHDNRHTYASHLVSSVRLLRAGFDELGEGGAAWRLTRFLDAMVVGEALGRTGQIGDGLVLIEEAIDNSERTEERWAIAEFLRIKGELLLLQGAPAAAATAENHFRQALDWARRQGALSWELRAATSLARLLCDQGRSADALALLQPIYDQFTEGFGTADLKDAKALHDALQ